MRVWHLAKWRALARWDGFPDFSVYRTLIAQERMSRGQIDHLRARKARHLAEECYHHVPYYRERMQQAGIEPKDIRSAEDLEKFPLLNKEIVRRQGMKLLNTTAAPQTYFHHTTGGSTGMPLDFCRGWEYNELACTAANMRAFRRMGWRPGDRLARLWSPHEALPAPMGRWARFRRALRHWLEPPELLLSAYEGSEAEFERWISRLRRFDPKFIYGYATNLVLFARFLSRRGISMDAVRGVASTAAALFPADRRLIATVFPRAVVIDIYGSREIPGIAAECALGMMHIQSDLVHVEFLPALDASRRHRLIITALDNTLFPYIRYDIGDSGSPLTVECPCGSPFPALEWGYGKIVDCFVAPDGRIIAGGFFEDLMFGIQGVHAYQFRQKTSEEIVLFIVPSDCASSTPLAEYTSRIGNHIHERFSPQIRFRAEIVGAIPPSPAGKHQFIVSEVTE